MCKINFGTVGYLDSEDLEESFRILCEESIALRVGSDKLNVTHKYHKEYQIAA